MSRELAIINVQRLIKPRLIKMKIWGIGPNGSGIIVLIQRSGVFILIYNTQSLKDPPGTCIAACQNSNGQNCQKSPRPFISENPDLTQAVSHVLRENTFRIF